MPLPSDPNPLVFQRVKGALKSVGMSQKDLAQHLGLAQGVVSLALVELLVQRSPATRVLLRELAAGLSAPLVADLLE